MVCLSLEKKRNQYEQVFVTFFWIVGYLIKKTPASPVPIVLLSFSIQTPSVISFVTKLLMGVSLKKKRNQYEQILAPFFWIVGDFFKKTPEVVWPDLKVQINLVTDLTSETRGQVSQSVPPPLIAHRPEVNLVTDSSLNRWCVFH